jgi:hypothetical protein
MLITVCERAKESCLRYPPKKRRLHWSFEAPADVLEPSEARRKTSRTHSSHINQRGKALPRLPAMSLAPFRRLRYLTIGWANGLF